jgi:hypothetical protein
MSLDEDETTSPLVRWEFTNDLLAGVYTGTYLLVVVGSAAGSLDATRLPENLLLSFIGIQILMTVWLFGPGAVAGVRRLLQR